MKKIFSNNRLIAIALLTVFSLSAGSVKASDKNPQVPVELKYSGFVKNLPVFELSFNGNADQNNFTIVISDEMGNSLYRENIKGEIFTKKFAINADELGDSNLKFEIFCNRTKTSVTFNVNKLTKVVQDYSIVEIK
jgi:hypothetical protein